MNSRGHCGGVVKLVITSACHAEGRGFESLRSRHFFLSQYFLFILSLFFPSKIVKNVDKPPRLEKMELYNSVRTKRFNEGTEPMKKKELHKHFLKTKALVVLWKREGNSNKEIMAKILKLIQDGRLSQSPAFNQIIKEYCEKKLSEFDEKTKAS